MRITASVLIPAAVASVVHHPRDVSAPFNIPWPSDNSWLDGHQWIPSALVTNSSRSPCPLLNTLANHGYIARDGRNITKDDFTNAQVKALNFAPALANKTTNAMVTKLGSPANESASFNLEDFASHDHTEHDASLTRLDQIQGSIIDVNPGLVVKLFDDSALAYLNTSSLGKSRARRESESVKIGSPKISDDLLAFAQLEASFILLVFGVGEYGNVDAIGAPKQQLEPWLLQERFPVEKGYARSPVVLTLDMQQALINGISKYYGTYK